MMKHNRIVFICGDNVNKKCFIMEIIEQLLPFISFYFSKLIALQLTSFNEELISIAAFINVKAQDKTTDPRDIVKLKYQKMKKIIFLG